MKIIAWMAGLVLCLLAVLVTLPFSGAGTRALVAAANQLEMLSIDYRRGRLFGELELNSVTLRLETLNLQLEDVGSDLQWRCFWHSEFCLERTAVSHVELEILEQDETAQAGKQASGTVVFPYKVSAAALDIESLAVRWPGGQWRQGAIKTRLTIDSSTVSVSEATLQSPVLEIEAGDDAAAGYSGFVPPAIKLPLRIEVLGLTLSNGELVNGDARWPLESAYLEGHWQGDAVVLSELRLAAPALGSLASAGRITFADAWPLVLDGELLLPETEWQGRAVQLAADGDLFGLTVALDSEGLPAVVIDGELAPADEGLPFSARWQVTWPDATTLGDIIDGLPAELALTGPLSGRVEGTLAEQEIRLQGQVRGFGYEALHLEADATWAGQQLDIVRMDVTDAPSDSQLSATARLQLHEGWSLEGSLESPGFRVPPMLAEQPGSLQGSLAFSASGNEDTWRVAVADVVLDGSVNGLPARIRGTSGLDSRLSLLPGTLEADINGARLSLAANQSGEGSAKLDLEELGRWLPGARGALAVRATGDIAREKFYVEASAKGVLYGQLALESLTAVGSWVGESGQMNATVSVPSLEVPEQELVASDLELTLTGELADHQLELRSAGDLAGTLSVTGGLEDGRWQGELKSTRLMTPAGAWTLPKPVPIEWDSRQGQLAVAPHCWQHEEFELCGDQLRAGAEGDVQLRLAGNARAFSGLLPRGLRIRGPLDANLQASWGADMPLALDVRGRGTDITVVRRYGMGQRTRVNWDSGEVYLRRREGELSATASIAREGREVFTLAAQLPESRTGSLTGTVQLNGLKLAALAPWVPEVSELAGQLSGRLELSGTPVDPRASGQLELRDGHLVALANPTALTDLQLTLSLKGDQGELEGRGLLGGGELRLRGQIYATPELRLELQVDGDRHEVLLPPASEMLVSEQLQLVLTEGLLEVAGKIRVHEGVVRHEELPESGVSMSSDVVLIDVNGLVIQEEAPFDIRADVAVSIRDRLQVEGDSLRATLGGDLQLVQEPGRSLQVFGSLKLIGGELRAYRQVLQVQRGTIAFLGPPDNPELNITAEREIRSDNVTVGARVIGRLEEPELEIFSTPAMSQSEALSYLVRGRGLDSGAGADGTALALSMGADVVNQSGMVSELNRLPLISDVAFGATGDEEETAATVSGYIGERIYLSYGIGIYEPINVLTARLYLQSRLWIEVVSRLENSVDIYYSFDID